MGFGTTRCFSSAAGLPTTDTDVSIVSTRESRAVLPRTRSAVATVAVIVAAGAVVSAVPAGTSHPIGAVNTVSAMPSLDVGIASRINVARAQFGLQPVRLSRLLGAAARAHSYEMARDGYFSHDSADGTSPWMRLSRYYSHAGYRRYKVGETLLWYSPVVDAATAVHTWLTSPEHRAILLSPGFREIGVSAVHATAADGSFRGDEVTLVTADFGVRSR